MQYIIIILVTFAFISNCFGAEATTAPSLAPKAAVEKWKDLRFGMFIHWGPVSLTAREIGWSRGAPTPIEEYDTLYTKFNPTQFNADEWVSIAKSAGMKYIILTTKHHDGFCLWDTKQTDYNIMNSPFNRDVVKELAEACKKQGILFGTYYSVTDWHHPYHPLGSPGGKTKKPNPNLPEYMDYLSKQVTELVKDHGPLLTMWFDVPQEVNALEGIPVVEMVRKLQPDILINNRAYRGFKGDYGTPEQKIGGFNSTSAWESCMTVSAHNHWAWGGEKDGVKDLKTCLGFLIGAAGGDGNMLLNVGPTPEGIIAPEQADRIKEMGQWLDTYGHTIYATRGGPWKPGLGQVSTHKGNSIFVHILDWKSDKLILPALGAKIIKSCNVTGGDVELNQTDKEITLIIAEKDRQPIDTIIQLDLDSPASDIKPIQTAPEVQPTIKK